MRQGNQYTSLFQLVIMLRGIHTSQTECFFLVDLSQNAQLQTFISAPTVPSFNGANENSQASFDLSSIS